MDTSQKSILQKYGVTEELLREEEEKQLKQDLWWKTASFVTGRPENVQQKRAQECLKELVEDKVHSKFLPPIESKLNSPISQAKKQGSVKWMWIMDPQFGSMKFVQVKVDSGARKNFITEGMVVDHHLQKTALEEPQPFDLAVGGIYCSYKVQVSLMGQDNEQATADFFVLPNDARIEIPLVGEEWTAHFMCKLFDSKDGGSIAYVEQKKPKADEERAAQTLRAQAMAQRSQLLQAKEAHEQQRSSQKTKVAGVEPQSISKEAKKTR